MIRELDPSSSQATAAFQRNKSAFTGVVNSYQSRVYNLCYRLLGEASEAEDAAQETFVRAYLHWRWYDPNRPLATWLMSIAAHHCIDRLRRRRIAWISLDDARLVDHPALRDHGPGPETLALRSERQQALQQLLPRLAARDRDVILQHYWGHLTCAEIAEATGSTVPAVKSRLHRARQRLSELMREEPTQWRPSGS